MHQNKDYNIIQAASNSPLFVVIRGQRLPSGAPATGYEIKTKPTTREKAIEIADRMQADYDSTQ
jgi:hypothetical protein